MLSEISLMAWMSGAIVFAIGGGVGFYIARQVKDKHTLGLEKQLETTQNQLSEYQGEVNRHFLKTSLLFNKLTDDYREVYEHLATGAQKLCNDKPLAATLDLPETKILTAAGAAATIASEEKPAVETITPAPSDAEHDDTTRFDTEAMASAETATETLPIEDADLPKEAAEEQVKTAQAHTESSSAEPSATEETAPTAAEAADATPPAITEEELKTLEANEQKKNEEEDVPLGAESTPSVKPEHHKTHPSIH
ncbi:hypothetical protein MNBD_GAMMA19-2103 [hydrothermal vent metagenome]|uniref:DUF1043 family protein n=1 Tax=hydrothermal vent metagenome TaxID=652676 RepID=A0A3B1AIX0_9ZZZZ